MSDTNTDDATVRVESENGMTEIEVHDEDAQSVVRGLLDALEPTVESADRIYVELEEEATDDVFGDGVDEELDFEAEDIEAVFGDFDRLDAGESEGSGEAEVEVEVEAEPDDNGASAEEMLRSDINSQTSIHAVASAIREHGPMRLNQLDDVVEDYPKGTISSALTNGKDAFIFERDDRGTHGRWDLTDWGHEKVREVGLYGEVTEDGVA